MVTNNETLKKLHNIQTQCSAPPLNSPSFRFGIPVEKNTHTHAHIRTLIRKYVYTRALTTHADITQPHSHAHAFVRTVPDPQSVGLTQ